MKTVAIIVAGGTGDRFGRAGGKQLAPLHGSTVLGQTVAAFERSRSVDDVVVVAHPDALTACAEALVGATKVVAIVAGGAERRDSVAAGLAAADPEADVFVVHDGARPLVLPGTIDETVVALLEGTDDCVAVGHPSYDTVKRVSAGGRVLATEDREQLWLTQTPQTFRAASLRRAYETAIADGATATDDAALVERIGGSVLLLQGRRDNLKVTVAEDLAIAEQILVYRERSS